MNVQIRDIVTRLHAHLDDMAVLAGAPRPDRGRLAERPVDLSTSLLPLQASTAHEHGSQTLYAPAGLSDETWREIRQAGCALWRPVANAITGGHFASDTPLQVRAYLRGLADCVVHVAVERGFDVRGVSDTTVCLRTIEFV